MAKYTPPSGALQAHASTHESGQSDPLTGTYGIQAIILVSGQKFYLKDPNANNIFSVDENARLTIKGPLRENWSSV